jgi:phenylacetic acid degradation operon negative regulatory protein
MNDEVPRSIGAPAARSMLLTVLGEYVAPKGRTIHRDTLVRALESLGYRTEAARQAVSRSVSAGWMTATRVGRRSRMELTADTKAMLSAGYPRIYGFGEPWTWNGSWLLVAVRVPEERRDERDRLRTRLAWAGFGSLGGGLWISPHVDRKGELREVVSREASGADVLMFSAEQLGDADAVEALVTGAWDMDAIADTYRRFLDLIQAELPADERSRFAAQTAIVHEWRKLPLVDPELPPSLLPPDWPQAPAVSAFRARHDAEFDAADKFFLALDGGG